MFNRVYFRPITEPSKPTPAFTGDRDPTTGRRKGRGVLVWPDGRRYEGGFQDDEFHGEAVMTWHGGRKYAGQYVCGKKHGRGVFTWPDGRRYDGRNYMITGRG